MSLSSRCKIPTGTPETHEPFQAFRTLSICPYQVMTIQLVNPQKILVVCLDNIGDCVLATSLLEPLRRYYPKTAIGMWVKSYTRELLSPSDKLNQIHAADPFWDSSPGVGRGSFGQFFHTWKDIRKERYDVAIILNTEWRRSLFCVLAGIPTRIGFNQRKSGYFLTHPVLPGLANSHMIDVHKALVSRWLKIDTNDSGCSWHPYVPISQSERDWGENWKQARSLGQKRIFVLAPLTGDVRKNWPLSHWKALVDQINGHVISSHFVVVGGAKDSSALGGVFSTNSNFEIVTGPSLSHFKSILSQAHVFIGGDSGPGHIAGALGIPMVSIFRTSNPAKYGPRGPGYIKILVSDPKDELTPDHVFHETMKILDFTSPQARAGLNKLV